MVYVCVYDGVNGGAKGDVEALDNVDAVGSTGTMGN